MPKINWEGLSHQARKDFKLKTFTGTHIQYIEELADLTDASIMPLLFSGDIQPNVEYVFIDVNGAYKALKLKATSSSTVDSNKANGGVLTIADFYEIRTTAVPAAPVILDGNNVFVPARTNSTPNVAPTATEVPTPINGDTAVIVLANGAEEFWAYQGGAWGLIRTKVAPTPETADNGLTKDTANNTQLGGALIKATAITTTATNTIAIEGLQAGAATDEIVTINPTTGVLTKSPVVKETTVPTTATGLVSGLTAAETGAMVYGLNTNDTTGEIYFKTEDGIVTLVKDKDCTPFAVSEVIPVSGNVVVAHAFNDLTPRVELFVTEVNGVAILEPLKIENSDGSASNSFWTRIDANSIRIVNTNSTQPIKVAGNIFSCIAQTSSATGGTPVPTNLSLGTPTATGTPVLNTNGTGFEIPSTDIAEGTKTASTVVVTSSTGADATLTAATPTTAGVMTAADKAKLDTLAPTVVSGANIGGSATAPNTHQTLQDGNVVDATDVFTYFSPTNLFSYDAAGKVLPKLTRILPFPATGFTYDVPTNTINANFVGNNFSNVVTNTNPYPVEVTANVNFYCSMTVTGGVQQAGRVFAIIETVDPSTGAYKPNAGGQAQAYICSSSINNTTTSSSGGEDFATGSSITHILQPGESVLYQSRVTINNITGIPPVGTAVVYFPQCSLTERPAIM